MNVKCLAQCSMDELLLEIINQRASEEDSQPGQAFLGWTEVDTGVLPQ